MQKIKLFLSVAAALVFAGQIAAQNKVTGIVTDMTNEPVPGAAVLVSGKNTGTSTNENGEFSVAAAPSDTLIVDIIGYVSQRIPVDGRSTILVKLADDTQQIEATVVIGYGSAQKIGNIVGSVKTVSAGDIVERPSANIGDALQGKVAGLQIFNTSGEPNSITTDVITAFKARVALGMKDYDTARIAAEAVIATKKYTLVSNATTYAEGWINDNLSETIFQLAMINSTEVGNAYSYFLYNSSGIEGRDNPQYIPEDWVLDLYDKNKDIRYAAYFDERTVTTPVVGKMTLLIKYPGNPKLYTKVTNYCNMPKVFRASEMYLIAAEAEYLSPNGSIAKANSYLNDLRKARIKGWSEKTYAGEALMSEIRNERVKELFCEGFRLSDLKRWHLGFTRSEGQDPSLIMQGENYATCTRPADDPQFLWPIPTSELEANPNMKDQQNPGYKMD